MKLFFKDGTLNTRKIKRKLRAAFAVKSRTEKLTDTRVQMRRLSADLRDSIFTDLGEIRRQKENHRRNTRAEARLKNAYTALFMVERAKTELEENLNDEQLARLINQTTQMMLKVNKSTLLSPEIGAEFFNWQADVLEGSAEEDPQAVLNISKTQQDSITQDIITRLMRNQSVDECLETDWDAVNPNVLPDDAPASFVRPEDLTDIPPVRPSGAASGPDAVPNLDDDESAARFQELLKQYNI